MVSHRVRREHRENISLLLTLENTFLLCDLYGLRLSFFKTCQLKSWRSQLTKYRAVAKRRGAYVAMLLCVIAG